MDIMEKVAYLKGLMDGLDLDMDSKEGKVFGAMLDVLDEMAMAVSDLQDSQDEMEELVDIIDEDLGQIEEIVYDDEDDDECCCDDDEYYEVVCPTCGDTICLDEEMVAAGEIECPNCHEELEFDFDECGCDDCGCGCDSEEDK